MSTAYDRGWGDPGDPNGTTRERNIERAWRAENIQVIEVQGIRLAAHKLVAPLFKTFINELCSGGYRLDRTADDWGYANRDVRGAPGVKSNHSWGLAVDLNATTNPMTNDGLLHTDLPPNVSQLAAKYGFRWGGDYSGRKDPMHFEFMGTPEDASRRVSQLSFTQNTEGENELTPAEMQDLKNHITGGLDSVRDQLKVYVDEKVKSLDSQLKMLRRDTREIGKAEGLVVQNDTTDGRIES